MLASSRLRYGLVSVNFSGSVDVQAARRTPVHVAVEQHPQPLGRVEPEVMPALRADAQAGREILVVDDLRARRALDPQPFGHPALVRRRLDRLADLLEPGHYWSIYQRWRAVERCATVGPPVRRHRRAERQVLRHVVPRALAHAPDLPLEIVERLVAPRQIELRRLDDEQRRGGVVEEEVVVGLVQLAHVLVVERRERPGSRARARAGGGAGRRSASAGRSPGRAPARPAPAARRAAGR